MPFDWKDYCVVASQLNTLVRPGATTTEALHRSSISRYYYALYNSADIYAKSHLGYVQPKSNSKHTALKDFYTQFPDDTVNKISYDFIRSIGNDLNSCLSFRVRADYSTSVMNRIERLTPQVERRVTRCMVFLS